MEQQIARSHPVTSDPTWAVNVYTTLKDKPNCRRGDSHKNEDAKEGISKRLREVGKPPGNPRDLGGSERGWSVVGFPPTCGVGLEAF